MTYLRVSKCEEKDLETARVALLSTNRYIIASETVQGFAEDSMHISGMAYFHGQWWMLR